MNTGRITEAALLIANVVERSPYTGIGWLNGDRWTVAVNYTKGTIQAFVGEGATIPFGHMAVWDGPNLTGVFSANEGYLNNADEFISDMRQLLEEK